MKTAEQSAEALLLADQIINAVTDVLPKNIEVFPLHEPFFGGNEWRYVKECIDTGWVSSLGKYVDRFEQDLAAYTGAKYAVVTVNGTAALHMCLHLAGVVQDDEVLVPALSFVATANAVAYCGAVPHFVDSEEDSLGLDPLKLADYLSGIAEARSGSCWNLNTGRRIAAVVPMHTFGHPVDMDPLLEICAKLGVVVVEDAAESLGSFYKGKHTGNFGLLSCLSFNGNKIVTTGGGGAILTNNAELAATAKHITTTAKTPHKWHYVHNRVGYNYRLPNISSALGCAQLERILEFVERKRQLASRYRDAFAGSDKADFFIEPDYAKSNYWLNAILLKPEYVRHREELLARMHAQNILARPAWRLLNELPMFSDLPCMDLSTAIGLEKSILNLPSSVNLGSSASATV